MHRIDKNYIGSDQLLTYEKLVIKRPDVDPGIAHTVTCPFVLTETIHISFCPDFATVVNDANGL